MGDFKATVAQCTRVKGANARRDCESKALLTQVVGEFRRTGNSKTISNMLTFINRNVSPRTFDHRSPKSPTDRQVATQYRRLSFVFLELSKPQYACLRNKNAASLSKEYQKIVDKVFRWDYERNGSTIKGNYILKTGICLIS
jgi:hypothetical protein